MIRIIGDVFFGICVDQLFSEVLNCFHETFFEGNFWIPIKIFNGTRYVWLTALGVVFDAILIDNITTGSAHQMLYHRCELIDRVLLGVA